MSTLTDQPSDFGNIIEYLEEESGVDIDSFSDFQNIIDKHQWCLHDVDINLLSVRVALVYFDENARMFLESKNPDIDIKEEINNIEPGYHPLMAAVIRMNYDHATFLLGNGANPNQGTEPWFPLLQADSNSDLKMIQLLENFGADWDSNIKIYEHWNKEVFNKPDQKYIKKTKA
jgi:hypothetical protein